MASIHRKRDSQYWHAAYYLPDGRRTLRSTGTSDRRKAQTIAAEFDKAARLGREARLTEARAREAIADIYAIANQDTLPSTSVKDYLANWLERKKLEVADSSFAAYDGCVRDLVAFLGDRASRPMDAISLTELSAFRDSQAKRIAGATVNKGLKILRGAWGRAVKDGLIQSNVFARLDLVKASAAARRGFTLAELRRILAECGDGEWRGVVLFGIYSGQRLSDIACLRHQNVDLQTGELRFVSKKTKRAMSLPMAKPLWDYLLTLPSSDDPDAQVFPQLSALAAKRVGTLSNQFSAILARAGLIEAKTHESTGKGRGTKREVCGLSFHCLRHSATSLLKNSGVSDVIARELIGHDSEAISRAYSHIETDALRAAVNKLPDIAAPHQPKQNA